MPDGLIRLVLPAAAEFTQVASVAVRAAARQVALPETEIDRLRAALVAAIEARLPVADGAPMTIELEPRQGALRVALDGEPIG
jgi:hypothetical protein